MLQNLIQNITPNSKLLNLKFIDANDKWNYSYGYASSCEANKNRGQYLQNKKLRTKFVKQQKSENDLSAYNNYHKLKTPENLTNITGFRSKIKN